MAMQQDVDPNAPVPTADELRMTFLQKELEEMQRREKAREAELKARASAAEDFLKGHVTDMERKMKATIISFPGGIQPASLRSVH
jgi:hypothetical protein